MANSNIVKTFRDKFGYVTHKMLSGLSETCSDDAFNNLTLENGMMHSDLILIKKIKQVDAATRALIDDRFRERVHKDSSSIVGTRHESLSTAFYRSQHIENEMKQVLNDALQNNQISESNNPVPESNPS